MNKQEFIKISELVGGNIKISDDEIKEFLQKIQKISYDKLKLYDLKIAHKAITKMYVPYSKASLEDIYFIKKTIYPILLKKVLEQLEGDNISPKIIDNNYCFCSNVEYEAKELNHIRTLGHILGTHANCINKLASIYYNKHEQVESTEWNEKAINFAQNSISIDEFIIKNDILNECRSEQLLKDFIHEAKIHRKIVSSYCVPPIKQYLNMNRLIKKNPEEEKLKESELETIDIIKNQQISQKDIKYYIQLYEKLISEDLKEAYRLNKDINLFELEIKLKQIGESLFSADLLTKDYEKMYKDVFKKELY